MGKYLGETKSGSVNGVTYSRNRYGQYIRRHAIPVNPNTQKQRLTRAAFAQASSVWSHLTEIERASWEDVANAYPITDKLGVQKTLDGHSFFIRYNVPQIIQGKDITRSLDLSDILPPVVDLDGYFGEMVDVANITYGSELSATQTLFLFNFGLTGGDQTAYAQLIAQGPLKLVSTGPKKFEGAFVAQKDFHDIVELEIPEAQLPSSNGVKVGTQVLSGYALAVVNASTVPTVASGLISVSRDLFVSGAWYRMQIRTNNPAKINQDILADFWVFYEKA